MEDGTLFLSSHLFKAVHVELAYERQEVCVFEVLGEDLVGEFRDVLDDK